MGTLVNGWEGEEGPARSTRQPISDDGRKQETHDGQNYEGAGPQGVCQKSMDAVRQKQQRLGYDLPERAQRVERKAISGRGTHLLWCGTGMSGRNGGA